MERQNQHDPENQKSDIMMELSAEQVRLIEFSTYNCQPTNFLGREK